MIITKGLWRLNEGLQNLHSWVRIPPAPPILPPGGIVLSERSESKDSHS